MAVNTIANGPAQRAQLLSSFIEAHFPVASKLEADMHRRASFMAYLPMIDLSSPILSNAVTSLCLAYFGAQTQNPRLLHESHGAYGIALSSLLQAFPLTSQSRAQTHRDVIATILLLSLYDECTPPQHRNPTTWVTHFWGALQYLEARGTTCINLDDPFDALMFQNLRFPAVILSFARRQACLFERPQWRSLKGKYLEGTGSNDWFPLLTPLGRLLQKADELLDDRTQSRIGEVPALYREFADFQQPLLTYLAGETQPSDRGPGLGLGETLVRNTTLRPDLEEHRFLLTTDVFPSYHKFLGGPRQQYRCTVSWFALLIADCTLLRLQLQYPSAAAPGTVQDIEAHAFAHATNLCRSVLHYSQLGSPAYAYALECFLQLAHAFLEDFGAAPRETAFAQGCLAATRMRVRRLETTSRPTLCRVQDLAGEFGQAGRYRMAQRFTYET